MSANIDDALAGLGNFDDEPISFGEAFGINPDGSAYEPPAADDADPAAQPEPPSPAPSPDATPPSSEEPPPTPDPEWKKRFGSEEDLWKSYRELETRFSQTRPQEQQPAPATPQQAPPPPVPLFKGDTAEIKTEADLYNWATADPEAAAMFAMQNHERLSPEQMNNVMDNWIARQPWKASTTIQNWNLQMMRDEIAERQAVQDQHYMEQVKDTGIARAIEEMPMLNDYRTELAEFIEQNPRLEGMVEAARTADELKQALHGIFYMMAGPRLAQQALETQVERQLRDTQAQQAAAQAAQSTQRATSLQRNTAPPPGDDQSLDDAIREKILNPGTRR